jgi:hypothetical protein
MRATSLPLRPGTRPNHPIHILQIGIDTFVETTLAS